MYFYLLHIKACSRHTDTLRGYIILGLFQLDISTVQLDYNSSYYQLYVAKINSLDVPADVYLLMRFGGISVEFGKT